MGHDGLDSGNLAREFYFEFFIGLCHCKSVFIYYPNHNFLFHVPFIQIAPDDAIEAVNICKKKILYYSTDFMYILCRDDIYLQSVRFEQFIMIADCYCSHVSHLVVHVLGRTPSNGFFGLSRIRITVFIDGRNSEPVLVPFHQTPSVKGVSVTFATSHPASTVKLVSFNLVVLNGCSTVILGPFPHQNTFVAVDGSSQSFWGFGPVQDLDFALGLIGATGVGHRTPIDAFVFFAHVIDDQLGAIFRDGDDQVLVGGGAEWILFVIVFGPNDLGGRNALEWQVKLDTITGYDNDIMKIFGIDQWRNYNEKVRIC